MLKIYTGTVPRANNPGTPVKKPKPQTKPSGPSILPGVPSTLTSSRRYKPVIPEWTPPGRFSPPDEPRRKPSPLDPWKPPDEQPDEPIIPLPS